MQIEHSMNYGIVKSPIPMKQRYSIEDLLLMLDELSALRKEKLDLIEEKLDLIEEKLDLREEKLQKLMILSELNKELSRLQDTLPTDLDHTD
jgi:hypothetical protein